MSKRVTEEEKLRKARARSHRWYHAHKHDIREKINARSNKWYHQHKGTIKLTPSQWKRKLEWQRVWRKKNPDKIREYERKQRENLQRVIKNRLCSRLRGVLKRKNIRKTGRTINLIGCSWKLLVSHITSQFQDGMSWSNRNLWHIDHIRPCASFDLTDPGQQKACFHYTNLQPLWSQSNMKKGKKWEVA